MNNWRATKGVCVGRADRRVGLPCRVLRSARSRWSGRRAATVAARWAAAPGQRPMGGGRGGASEGGTSGSAGGGGSAARGTPGSPGPQALLAGRAAAGQARGGSGGSAAGGTGAAARGGRRAAAARAAAAAAARAAAAAAAAARVAEALEEAPVVEGVEVQAPEARSLPAVAATRSCGPARPLARKPSGRTPSTRSSRSASTGWASSATPPPTRRTASSR